MPHIVFTPSRVVAEQVPGPGSTTIRVANSGTALDGLELQISPGAFPYAPVVRIVAGDISSFSLPANLVPAAPLIGVDTHGTWAETPITLRIPTTIPSGMQPVAYCFRPTTGQLAPIPITDVESTSVTVAAKCFSDSVSTLPNKKDGTSALLLFENWVLLAYFAPSLVPDKKTAFDVGIHCWRNPNIGSVVTPGGFCGGWNQTAAWCFERNVPVPVSSEINEARVGGNHFNTPAIWQDNRQAIQFQSAVQRRTFDGDNISVMTLRVFNGSDRQTLQLVRKVLFDTSQPQIITASSSSTANAAHSLLIVETRGDDLIYVDPNIPTCTQILHLSGDRFSPINSSVMVGTAAVVFESFYFLPPHRFVQPSEIVRLYSPFQFGGFNEPLFFPRIGLRALSDASSMATAVSLYDGFVTASPVLRLCASRDGAPATEVALRAFFGGSDTTGTALANLPEINPTTGAVFPIRIGAGKTSLGLQVNVTPEYVRPSWTPDHRLTNGLWADFQWFDVWYLASPTRFYGIASGSQVELNWAPVDGAESYNVYWQNSPGVTSSSERMEMVSCTQVSSTRVKYQYTVSPADGTPFYYRVAAVRGGVVSALSDEGRVFPWTTRFYRQSGGENDGLISDYQYVNEWREGPNQKLSWTAANDWATQLGAGWRLPYTEELRQIWVSTNRMGDPHEYLDQNGNVITTEAAKRLHLNEVFQCPVAYNIWLLNPAAPGVQNGYAPVFDFHSDVGSGWSVSEVGDWNIRALAVRKKP